MAARVNRRSYALRAVVFQEGDWLCAQCLEYDIATQAKTLDDLRHDLERLIVGHIAISLAEGIKPFQNVRPAPKKYWDMFRRSRIPLPPQKLRFKLKKRGIRVLPPRIRVASVA